MLLLTLLSLFIIRAEGGKEGKEDVEGGSTEPLLARLEKQLAGMQQPQQFWLMPVFYIR